jgi:hypothetical protein
MRKQIAPLTEPGAGGQCPCCGATMDRQYRPAGWRPSPWQNWYYTQWERCLACGHHQYDLRFRVELKSVMP